MRFPDLSRDVTLTDGRKYTLANMLAEFVWGAGFWSVDEASVASFERCKKAWHEWTGASADSRSRPGQFVLEDKDFDRICAHLRNLNFPPHVAIELTELRNAFVMAPTEQRGNAAPPGEQVR